MGGIAMKTIKKIAVGIDFSDYSQEILKYAGEIAKLHPAEIIAVNVINRREVEYLDAAMNNESADTFSSDKFIGAEKEKRAAELAEMIKQWIPPSVPSQIIIRNGTPFEEILVVVKDEKVDLLVINSKGRSTFRDYMFGTTAEKIFRHCPVSLLSLNLTIVH
jgi:nucleotide-binding universal stress UspA family protein